jgi:multiple sugar transport system ATP-binding protein
MNLIRGTVVDGVFAHAGGKVALPDAPDGDLVLGIRPEDISVTEDTGDCAGSVYASELLGDVTLLNVRSGDVMIAVKVAAEAGREMDSAIALRFDPAKLHLFDAGTGARLP